MALIGSPFGRIRSRQYLAIAWIEATALEMLGVIVRMEAKGRAGTTNVERSGAIREGKVSECV